MLPPKIGEGVFGSNSGGVKPTGASFVGVSVCLSAAAALMVLDAAENLSDLGVVKGERDVKDCFQGAATRSPEFEVDKVGVKREAWVAMAMKLVSVRCQCLCER